MAVFRGALIGDASAEFRRQHQKLRAPCTELLAEFRVQARLPSMRAPRKTAIFSLQKDGGRQLKAPSAHNLRLSNIFCCTRNLIIKRRLKRINVFYYIDRQLVFVEKAASELDRARGRVFLPVACRIATRYDALLISCRKSVFFLAFVAKFHSHFVHERHTFF